MNAYVLIEWKKALVRPMSSSYTILQRVVSMVLYYSDRYQVDDN